MLKAFRQTLLISVTVALKSGFRITPLNDDHIQAGQQSTPLPGSIIPIREAGMEDLGRWEEFLVSCWLAEIRFSPRNSTSPNKSNST